MGIQDCIDWAFDVTAGMNVVNKTVEYGDNANDYPLAIVYPTAGNYSARSLGKRGTSTQHTINVEIQFPLERITDSMEDALCAIDEFRIAFYEKVAQNVEGIHSVTSPTYTFGEHTAYQNVTTYGPVFEFTIETENMTT